MANGIRTGNPRGFNKGRSSKFREGFRVRQTPEEGRRTYRPKRWEITIKMKTIVRKPFRICWIVVTLWDCHIHADAVMLHIDLRPGQTCHSKDGGSCIFHWRGQAWLTIWDRVKIPRYSHKLMHRKRVTCELHDSYFRSMTIKHAIPKTAEVHIPMASYGKRLGGR